MKKSPGRDILAGITVAIVALPLALAFGVASGLGAEAGITTAIIAGALAAIFGGSNVQVSGPTGAMTVVLIPVVVQFGPARVLQVGVMAGVVLLGLSLSGVGRYVRFLPSSLVEGFTAGIAVVIALQQLPNILGVQPGDYEKVWQIAVDGIVQFAHNPDRELFGQGIANHVVPFFGGVPATAAIARTAVNVKAGARSRLSSITHSVVLLLFILVAAPLVGIIPLAALGGVLLAVTVQMVQVGAIRSIIRSSRGDAIVLILTFAVTVAIDLVTAVIVGLALAGIFALRAVAKSAQVQRVPLDRFDHTDEEQSLLDDRIVAFRLDGALFLGAAHRFLLELSDVADVAVVILRMGRLSTIDATGALMLDDAIVKLEKRGITVLLSGIKPGHQRMLAALTSAPRLMDAGRVFAETPDAIAFARESAAP